jgi:hypothetical protein
MQDNQCLPMDSQTRLVSVDFAADDKEMAFASDAVPSKY